MKIKYRRNNDTQVFLVWMAGHVILPLTRPMYVGKGINLENRKGRRTAKTVHSLWEFFLYVFWVQWCPSEARMLKSYPESSRMWPALEMRPLPYNQVRMKLGGWVLIQYDCALRVGPNPPSALIRGRNVDTDMTHRRRTCAQGGHHTKMKSETGVTHS